MELEELRHVELEAYREGVLQLRDPPIVEGKYLDGELLKVIEISRGRTPLRRYRHEARSYP